MMRSLLSVALLSMSVVVYGANLANPAIPVPNARMAIGASYHLGGYTITNNEVPCILNRLHARASYAPFSLINFGVDAGASQVHVAGDTTATDTFATFAGKYAFSFGGHVKLATPFFFNDLLSFMLMGQGTSFSSKNDLGAAYEGLDINGAFGIQFHIKGFGYITAGPQLYLIDGEGKHGDGTSRSGGAIAFKNVNNLRGWLAIDFFPKMKTFSENKTYVSFEVTLSPDVAFFDRAPVQEIAFSLGFGTVTKRLYGEANDVEWEP
ncbi:MAG: hypothetical protein GF398_18480 [Chitinivibrionales bacterium]|nr:hypothetical protein [Chitinivibrionales bacterium]